MKYIGKVGHGRSVHTVTKFVRDDGAVFYSTACGADHCTNRHTTVKVIAELDPTRVTCKKCQSKLEGGV